MNEEHYGAGSEPVAGSSRSIEDISLQELIAEFPPSPARVPGMDGRFPVPLEEYRQMELAARQPEEGRLAARADATTVDADLAAELAGLDLPEDQVAVAPTPAAPPTTASFEGIPQTAYRPPDNAIAVGPDRVMLAVNVELAVYSKAGALQFRWPNMTTLFNPVMPAGAQLFDPQLAYDHYAGRWIVVIAARRASPAGSWLMVAVSQGSNPAGPYWIWALDARLDGSTATNNWADFPQLGFDTQAIYIASNMFMIGGSGTFQYVKLRILNKAELYAGGVGPNHTVRWYDFWNLRNPNGSTAFTVIPAKHFRGTGGNPPAYLVNALWPSGNQLTLWTLSNPLALWSGGAPTLARNAVACRPYDLPPDALQSGSTVRIETNDSRLLHAVYQHAGGVQRLWTCHTSRFTWSGDTEARSVVQWYEIDIPTRAVTQQNAYGASGLYYFFPAIQTDGGRNAYVVFGRSGAGEFAQQRQTGRKVGDPPNDLQNSALVRAGLGAYTGQRWGDYFGICRDGGDANQVWMYGEYANTGNTWGTRVSAAKF
jgi:hypothetical protein